VTAASSRSRRDELAPDGRPQALVAALAGVALPARSRDVAAELAALLRWTRRADADGGLAAEVDSSAIAVRLVSLLSRMGIDDGAVEGDSVRGRWRVTVDAAVGADLLARVGLVDPRGRPCPGLAPWLVGGSLPQAVTAWRGALLAAGRFATSDDGDVHITVACPSTTTALGLAEIGLRLGVRARSARGAEPRLAVDEPGEGALLLASCGGGTVLAAAGLVATADASSANATRAAVAAARAVSAVGEALAALESAGVAVPDQLAEAGRLRLRHPELGLGELAALAQPPLSKDMLAGRLRRLSALAARHRARRR